MLQTHPEILISGISGQLPPLPKRFASKFFDGATGRTVAIDVEGLYGIGTHHASLTTVVHDIVGKGRLAAAMVFANGPTQQVVMAVELLLRGSTAPPRS